MVYLEAAIQGFSSKKSQSILCILGEFPWWGSFPARLQALSAVLAGVGSFVGVSQVFFLFYYLFCERLFLDFFLVTVS